MTRARHPRGRLRPLALSLALLLGLAGPAFAVGADRMASEIELNLAGIESMARIQPERAQEQLRQQERMLELLEHQRPDHPKLEELGARLEALAELVAREVANEEQGVSTDPMAEVLTAEASAALSELTQIVADAESLQMQPQNPLFARQVERAKGRLEAFVAAHEADIPPAYAPLIVLQERVAMLADHLEAAGVR
jgi:hypothetical protein